MKKQFAVCSLLLVVFLFFLLLPSYCQQNKIDSLLFLLKQDREDTSRVNHLTLIADELRNSDPEKAIDYGKKALALSPGNFFKAGTAKANIIIGTAVTNLGKYDEALKYLFAGLDICLNINDKKNTARALGNIGIVYGYQGNYPLSLGYYFKALKIDEELKDKSGIAKRLSNIGLIYWNMGDYSKALDCYFKALRMAEELGDKHETAITLGNIGLIYSYQDNYSKALDCYFKALKMAEELGDKKSQAVNLGNIGNVYYELGVKGNSVSEKKKSPPDTCLPSAYFDRSLEYYFKALKMKEELGAVNEIASTFDNIGLLYVKQKKHKEAEMYLLKALALSDSIGDLYGVQDVSQNLSELYSQYPASNYKLALEYYKKAMALKDTLFSQEKNKEITRKEMTYEFEKKEAAVKAAQEKISAVANAEKKKQQVVLHSVILGLFIVLVFAGFIFRALKITRRQKQLIEEQKRFVEEKQKEILDSIHYARRIQTAILPTEKYIGKTLNRLMKNN